MRVQPPSLLLLRLLPQPHTPPPPPPPRAHACTRARIHSASQAADNTTSPNRSAKKPAALPTQVLSVLWEIKCIIPVGPHYTVAEQVWKSGIASIVFDCLLLDFRQTPNGWEDVFTLTYRHVLTALTCARGRSGGPRQHTPAARSLAAAFVACRESQRARAHAPAHAHAHLFAVCAHARAHAHARAFAVDAAYRCAPVVPPDTSYQTASPGSPCKGCKTLGLSPNSTASPAAWPGTFLPFVLAPPAHTHTYTHYAARAILPSRFVVWPRVIKSRVHALSANSCVHLLVGGWPWCALHHCRCGLAYQVRGHLSLAPRERDDTL